MIAYSHLARVADLHQHLKRHYPVQATALPYKVRLGCVAPEAVILGRMRLLLISHSSQSTTSVPDEQSTGADAERRHLYDEEFHRAYHAEVDRRSS